jgi:serine/threonine protein kinase
MHFPVLSTVITSKNGQPLTDYTEDLFDYDLEFINTGDYLEVGEILKILCWVLHRDLNPENLLIYKSGRIFFIDLELAYSIKTSEPNPPFVWGTPGFMSAEQLANEILTTKRPSLLSITNELHIYHSLLNSEP